MSRRWSTASSTSWRDACVRRSSTVMASDRPDSEEAIIGAYFAPLAKGYAGAFGLKDDCAAIMPEPGCDLVVTTDAVIAGVHFFPGAAANEIAWKALAVNVSDLVAKGATPFAYVMS